MKRVARKTHMRGAARDRIVSGSVGEREAADHDPRRRRDHREAVRATKLGTTDVLGRDRDGLLRGAGAPDGDRGRRDVGAVLERDRIAGGGGVDAGL